MKTEIAKRIKNFIKEIEPRPMAKYRLLYVEKDYTVLMEENCLHIYILEGKVYQEEVPLYPIFSFEEIKEALTQFNLPF